MGTTNVPKVLTMLNNKPLILYTLEEIEKINQLAKPVVVVGYMAEKVKAVLGTDFLYALQTEQLGTGHAVLSAKKKVKAENILVLHGDQPFIQAESLKALIAMHFKKGGNISMLTAQVDNFRGVNKTLESAGRIIRDPHHNIAAIVEYKDASTHQKKIKEINTGIYMFNTKWLWANLEKIKNHNKQKEYYLTDIIDIAIGQGQRVASLMIDPKEALGINSKEDLELALSLLKS